MSLCNKGVVSFYVLCPVCLFTKYLQVEQFLSKSQLNIILVCFLQQFNTLLNQFLAWITPDCQNAKHFCNITAAYTASLLYLIFKAFNVGLKDLS